MQALGRHFSGWHYSGATTTEGYDAVLRLARSIVEASGACDLLKTWETEDRARLARHPGGRPAELDYLTALTMYLAHGLMRRGFLHKHVTEMFTSALTPEQRGIVGAPPSSGSSRGVTFTLYRRFRAIEDLIDPTPGPRRSGQTQQQVKELHQQRKANAELLGVKERRRTELLNRLVAASVRTLPRAVRRHNSGIFAVDATHAPLPGRPRSARSIMDATIYDGGWYVRDNGDEHGHDGTTGYTKKRRGKYVWALEVELVVRGALSYTAQDSPLLIHALNVHKPAAQPAASAAEAITLMPQLYPDQPLRYLAGDRLYLPNGKPTVFQGPMRDLGFKLLMDYPVNQLGVQDHYGGALLVDGSWCCPAMPKDLVEATIQHSQKLIDDEVLAHRIEGRRAFLLQPKEQPTPSKTSPYPNQKWRCPAAGPSPTVRCPLKPNTRGNPSKSILPAMTPQRPDSVCTNRESLTIPGQAGLKTRQDLPYLTPEWRAHYQGPRAKVESVNNKVKSSAHEGFGSPSSRLARSATAQAIFATIAVIASNCTRVFTFLKTYKATPTPERSDTSQQDQNTPAVAPHTTAERRGPP